MAKTKTIFFCTNCGNETPKWMGRCPSCGAYNTMEEHIEKPVAAGKAKPAPVGMSRKPQRIREVTGFEVKATESCDPFTSPVESEEMQRILAAYAKAFGKEVTPSRMCGATDARHLYKIGRPVYVSGINGSGAHSVEEKLQLDSIDKGAAMILDLL